MIDDDTEVSPTDDLDVLEVLRDLTPEHPALARLRGDLIAGSTADQTITSYDRMHHRHNRS